MFLDDGIDDNGSRGDVCSKPETGQLCIVDVHFAACFLTFNMMF